jgi:phenylacetate-CoA ligase
VLPDGERGELVFTSLTKEALPIVRYRTRDLTRLLPGTARSMRRIEKVTGRTDDMVILRGVNLFPTQIEELILRVQGLSPHFQLVLSRPHRLDELTVRVETRPGVAGPGERIAAGQALTDLIRDNVGVSVVVDVLEPGLLERSAGKAQRLIDLRGA